MKTSKIFLSLMVGIALGYWVASTGGRSEAGASPELRARNDAAPAKKEASVSTGKVQSGDDSCLLYTSDAADE